MRISISASPKHFTKEDVREQAQALMKDTTVKNFLGGNIKMEPVAAKDDRGRRYKPFANSVRLIGTDGYIFVHSYVHPSIGNAPHYVVSKHSIEGGLDQQTFAVDEQASHPTSALLAFRQIL